MENLYLRLSDAYLDLRPAGRRGARVIFGMIRADELGDFRIWTAHPIWNEAGRRPVDSSRPKQFFPNGRRSADGCPIRPHGKPNVFADELLKFYREDAC